MSSLNTLLEAARFLELQEQSRETVAETLVTMKPAPAPPSVAPVVVPPIQTPIAAAPPLPAALPPTAAPPLPDCPPQQTVIISSSSNQIGGHHQAIIQGPITFASTPALQFVKKIEQDGQVSSTTATSQHPPRRILHNSFDIRNPLIIDESNACEGNKRKQPPMVFRAGTREVHNKLEKHRRAHLKECFDVLKKQLPASQDEKKTSNLSILHSALRFIQNLKRKERELEHEMERLAREKISAQQRLAVLKKDISSRYDNVDFAKILPDVVAASPCTSMSRDTFSVGDYGHEDVCMSVDAPTGPVIDKVAIPILAKTNIPMVKQHTTLKEVPQQVQTTSLSVLPMSYPVNQGLVLQKVLVPKGLDGLTPIVSTHFIATPQQINGKVVPLTQYLVKPMVVVSTASPRPS